MKKLKKVLLLSGAALAGVSLLTGCTTASNSSTTSSQSSDNKDKKETEKKSQYDTTGLKEESLYNGKFFTSFSGEWVTKTQQGLSFTMLVKENANISVALETNDKLVTGVTKEWSSVSKSKIETMLTGLNPTKLTVEKTEVNGKEAFLATYKIQSASGIQYYIKLDDTHTALVTYTSIDSSAEMEKELKHVTNTIEYVK